MTVAGAAKIDTIEKVTIRRLLSGLSANRKSSGLSSCVFSAGPGLDSDTRQWVSLPIKVNHGLSHIGNVRSAIPTTRCNSLRLAPPAASTAIP